MAVVNTPIQSLVSKVNHYDYRAGFISAFLFCFLNPGAVFIPCIDKKIICIYQLENTKTGYSFVVFQLSFQMGGVAY